MTELRFTSSLTIEEIENNFKNVDVFSGITEGLEEILKYDAETIEAMVETERIASETSVKGYTNMDEMFADLGK